MLRYPFHGSGSGCRDRRRIFLQYAACCCLRQPEHLAICDDLRCDQGSNRVRHPETHCYAQYVALLFPVQPHHRDTSIVEAFMIQNLAQINTSWTSLLARTNRVPGVSGSVASRMLTGLSPIRSVGVLISTVEDWLCSGNMRVNSEIEPVNSPGLNYNISYGKAAN